MCIKLCLSAIIKAITLQWQEISFETAFTIAEMAYLKDEGKRTDANHDVGAGNVTKDTFILNIEYVWVYMHE